LVHRRRIEIAVDLVGEALEKDWDRARLEKELSKRYEEEDISPFRGLALPADIIDKEMSTLYVVSKYGLGLDEETSQIFDYERRLEKAAEIIMRKEPDARAKVLELVGEINSNTLSRIFRVVFTAIILGFRQEEDLIRLLHAAQQLFPEEARTVKKYARFYIAFKVAEAIAKGDVYDKLTKEALKQSLALRLNLPKILPDDDYIYTIAKEVFNVNEKKLKNILKVKREKEVR